MPTLDHITPLHMGGDPYNPANLRVICYGCNARRGALTRTAAQRNQATIRRLWRSRVW